jgi:hypothetical protein
MHMKSFVAVSAIAASLSAAAPAWSQSPMDREAELIGMHQLCDRGDRQACIRFGFMLGQAQERHAEWRRTHPDWWAWEHR